MVLRQGVWDSVPDTIKAGVRVERGPRGNSLGDVLVSILGGLFQGGLNSNLDDFLNSEESDSPSVSWREGGNLRPMRPRLELRARHQARVRGHVQESNYTDPVEAWLAFQDAESKKQMDKSTENVSVTKTVKGWVGPSSPDDNLDPTNKITTYEKSAPTAMPEYVGEMIANTQFTDPRVTQWYPNSAELYDQELARVQAEQREQQIFQAMQQANPTQTLVTRFGQEVRMNKRGPQGKSSGVTIRKKTLRELVGEVYDHSLGYLQDPHYQGKLSYDARQLFQRPEHPETLREMAHRTMATACTCDVKLEFRKPGQQFPSKQSQQGWPVIVDRDYERPMPTYLDANYIDPAQNILDPKTSLLDKALAATAFIPVEGPLSARILRALYSRPIKLLGNAASKRQILNKLSSPYGINTEQVAKITKIIKDKTGSIKYKTTLRKLSLSQGAILDVSKKMSDDGSGSFIEIYRKINRTGDIDYSFKVTYDKNGNFVHGRLTKTKKYGTIDLKQELGPKPLRGKVERMRDFERLIQLMEAGEI